MQYAPKSRIFAIRHSRAVFFFKFTTPADFSENILYNSLFLFTLFSSHLPEEKNCLKIYFSIKAMTFPGLYLLLNSNLFRSSYDPLLIYCYGTYLVNDKVTVRHGISSSLLTSGECSVQLPR